MKHNSKQRSHRNVHFNAEQCDCVERAYRLFEFYQSRCDFPIFWTLIDRDREKLATIFLFFCKMRTLLESDDSGAKIIADNLWLRLSARFSGGPPPIPFGLEKEIKLLSRAQAIELQKLDELNLVEPAFVLFASGSLTLRRRQYSIKGLGPTSNPIDPKIGDEFLDFEPDGPAFFYWAEFAFLASYAGFDSMLWKDALPVLLKTERIFALCYGEPQNGMIPNERKFGHYDPEKFQRIHPDDAAHLAVLSTTRFDELEREATECARFAFPKEFS